MYQAADIVVIMVRRIGETGTTTQATDMSGCYIISPLTSLFSFKRRQFEMSLEAIRECVKRQ